MTTHYEIASTWGGKISLDFNDSRDGAKAHSVMITAETGINNEVVYLSVKGEKNIRDFIYNFAVIGGIIKEGDTLEIHEPSDKEVPEDGVYRLTGASENRRIAVVQGGRVMIPQPEEVEIIDYTDVYLSKYSQWSLTPLTKTERRTQSNA
jgi:hypothetical protein